MDWLKGKVSDWPEARARAVAAERIAVRWHPTAHVLGSIPQKPDYNKDGIQIAALSDLNKWKPWTEVRPSQVVEERDESGFVIGYAQPSFGLFAGRAFAKDDVVTRFAGRVAPWGSAKASEWLRTNSKAQIQEWCFITGTKSR